MPSVRVDLDRLQLALASAWSHVLARGRSGASAGLTARASPDGCELTFWDSRPPLTPEGDAHVFDRREQALRGHELGSAIRMAMARAHVQAHGGRAQVGSLSGRTLFQFVLPPPG
jgi:signal transduction histidine kinase